MTAHKQAVLRLYRHMLKDSKSWAVDRGVWMKHAATIRQRFETHRTANPAEAAKLLAAEQAKFESNKHPDPYRPCTSLDGSKWERNCPPPADVVQAGSM
ncbi:hypothetical protein PTSG_05482 [Salpingoeca rosetta]|uniref:NADH dehydrogenase [ubiquinone] 1 beta subcomplex subunit 9 n=1 Tax=Salpingoeca rosetta (strain ATCC 50818 / BSB-021) TaxID=946362 RepID=F2UBC3_SALR5|nr:uncharacterized protein PTSG_05482 [Salpingoeca rosetta]EGD73789.1 hypothetical protein PTSG_05482 [Salpingoeca rosetta]|eukprot:XP_004993352.1 hypothetical protein PTSG_05482 [Salpingoeca rosetta]